jgi:glycosyltransferase involved in cell wall biosynthesis
VALFVPSLTGGGAERVMVDLAQALSAAGHRVDLVLARAEGPFLAHVPANVPVVDLAAPRVAAALPGLVRYLRRVRPRAILSTLEHANILTLIAARFAPSTRVVLREANTSPLDQGADGLRGRVVAFLMRRAYPRADAVVAVSAGVADALRSAVGVPGERIEVIANPVVTERVLAGADRDATHPWLGVAGVPVVLGVGRLAPQKGFDVLLEAFARVRADRPCRLLILGEGDERPRLEALAAELGIEDDVALPGFDPDPFPAMARADVFALSSRWEGLPNALIQAMALGTPAVATDCPSGPSEISEGGRLARLVPVGDVEALADAIRATLDRPLPPADASWRSRYDPVGVARRYAEVLGVAPADAREAPTP